MIVDGEAVLGGIFDLHSSIPIWDILGRVVRQEQTGPVLQFHKYALGSRFVPIKYRVVGEFPFGDELDRRYVGTWEHPVQTWRPVVKVYGDSEGFTEPEEFEQWLDPILVGVVPVEKSNVASMELVPA